MSANRRNIAPGTRAGQRSPRERRLFRDRLAEAQNHRCAYCGVRFGAEFRHWLVELTAATIDRVIPGSQGGTYTWENCVAACKRCNEARGSEDALEFFERKGWLTARDLKLGEWLDRAIRKAAPIGAAEAQRRRLRRKARQFLRDRARGRDVSGYSMRVIFAARKIIQERGLPF